MYCNTVEFFQGHERDELRGDPYEGISHAWRLSTHRLYIAHQLIEEPEGRIDIVRNADLKKNIFCLYAVRTDCPFIDHRNLKFGDTCVYIRNPPEFMRRVEIALRDQQPRGCQIVHGGPVTYVDRKTHDGKVGPFTKFDSFAYQSEYRFVISPGRGRPFSFQIGSIEDIADTFESSMANRVFGFEGAEAV